MKCDYCNTEVAANMSVCPVCGRVVNIKKVCIFCKNELKQNAKFCAFCGKPVHVDRVEDSKRAQKPSRKNISLAVIPAVLLSIAAIVVGTLVITNTIAEKKLANALPPSYEASDDEKDNEVLSESDENDEDVFEEETFTHASEVEVDESDDTYLFPTDTEYITASDIDGKSKEEVALIRNEIYARNGYVFQKEPYKSYFEAKDWYVPNVDFNEKFLNDIEKANKDFIVEFEKSMGWRK